MILNGYIVKYTNNSETTFYNQTQLSRELRTCTKSIYTYFSKGYGNLKDLNIKEVLKVKNGVVVGKFYNKEIEKYNKKALDNASCWEILLEEILKLEEEQEQYQLEQELYQRWLGG